jgi:hypothetical protein
VTALGTNVAETGLGATGATARMSRAGQWLRATDSHLHEHTEIGSVLYMNKGEFT